MTPAHALFTAADEAHGAAAALDRARFDPGMRLGNYLQPLQDVSGAAASAATVAHLAGQMAEAASGGADVAAAAGRLLRSADRRCTGAAEQLGGVFDEVRLALRRAGLVANTYGEPQTVRPARGAQVAMARLSSAAESASGAPVPPTLQDLAYVAAVHCQISGCLYRAVDRMGQGITAAYGQLPRYLAAESGRAAGRAGSAAEAFKRVFGVMNQASNVLSAAYARETRRALS
jgi:hypothetical protein